MDATRSDLNYSRVAVGARIGEDAGGVPRDLDLDAPGSGAREGEDAGGLWQAGGEVVLRRCRSFRSGQIESDVSGFRLIRTQAALCSAFLWCQGMSREEGVDEGMSRPHRRRGHAREPEL